MFRHQPRKFRNRCSAQSWLLNEDGSIFCMVYGSNDGLISSTSLRFVRYNFHSVRKPKAWYGWDSDRHRTWMAHNVRRPKSLQMRAGWEFDYYYRSGPLEKLRKVR